MKKIIAGILLIVAAFLAYRYFVPPSPDTGAFDEQGRPLVLVFTMNDCGTPCANVAESLKRRNISFEEVNLSEEGRRRYEKFGVNGWPLTVIGEQKILGDNLSAIENALAEAYGMDVLSEVEQRVMRNHFDENGNPRVVMYGTSWCPYCRKMKEYFTANNIPYIEFDVETSDRGKVGYDLLKGTGYPLTYVGYRRINGYDEEEISKESVARTFSNE